MATKPTDQIIPFPFPVYIATFLANRITNKPVLTEDGSILRPFNVTKHTPLGNFILKQLKQQLRPSKKEGFMFFIKISEFSTHKSKDIEDARSSPVAFNEDEIESLTTVFKEIFETHLLEYVKAFRKGVKSENQKKQRGIIDEAIFDFCKENRVVITNKNIVAWRKMIQRSKSRPNSLRISVL